jgi:phospholipid/cholesterol/gamma-HCH transport system substrate-binding protein
VKNISAGVRVGILAILMLVGGYAVWKSLRSNPAGESSYDLWAKFRDASGMPLGSKVVVAGLPVGEITGLSIEGRYAHITFRVRSDVAVWSNAVVYKKSVSLLGDHYLEIDPGEGNMRSPVPVDKPPHKLEDGDQVLHVVEATSPDQILRHIDDVLPKVDEVLASVKNLSEDVRRLVNGPLASAANQLDQLIQQQSGTVADILAKADSSITRIDEITKDVRAITGGANPRIDKILDNLDAASSQAKDLVASAKKEVEDTGTKVREKLDLVDEVIQNTNSITKKIDSDRGTLGKLVNDGAIADNVEQITDDARGFLGTLFNLQAYVGLRTEYNVFAREARNYISIELHTRPDKYYLFELERGPRGGYPDVTLTFDPTVDPNNWIRTASISNSTRFTFQFAKRLGWLTLRYGLRESSGGIGADADFNWWGKNLHLSADLYDATWDQLPRLKVAAAYEVLRHVYVLGGIDDALNTPQTLTVVTGNTDVPIQFDTYHYGRDYYFGGMIRFNDKDLAALLAVGGSALSSAATAQ